MTPAGNPGGNSEIETGGKKYIRPRIGIRARISGKSLEETNMPLIEVHLLEGRTNDQKKALMKAITQAVHESIGAPLPSIRIWLQELPPTEYMVAGELYADRKS